MSLRPVLLGLVVCSAACATAGTPAQKQADIRKLLVLTGAAKIGTQAMAQMMVSMKQAMPQVPARFWTDFQAEVKTEELTELVVPIYDKHLTFKDVRTLIHFYETPTGKRFITEMPAITKESMVAGQAWGQAIGKRVVEKLRAELAAQQNAQKP
ncbi:MAG: DUF2059 domain-containing protein [Polyangia bacterium]